MSFLVLPHHDSNRPANETIVACNYLNLMRQPPTAYSEEIGVDPWLHKSAAVAPLERHSRHQQSPRHGLPRL